MMGQDFKVTAGRSQDSRRLCASLAFDLQWMQMVLLTLTLSHDWLLRWSLFSHPPPSHAFLSPVLRRQTWSYKM